MLLRLAARYGYVGMGTDRVCIAQWLWEEGGFDIPARANCFCSFACIYQCVQGLHNFERLKRDFELAFRTLCMIILHSNACFLEGTYQLLWY